MNTITGIDRAREINARREAAGGELWSLTAAELVEARADGVLDFSDANLRGADLQGVNLWNANLSGADLRDASLRFATLWGARLTYAELNRADIRGAYLQGVNLTEAQLRDANLSGADLQGVNLTDANLSGAQLHGANLRGADLTDANLSGAHLHNANLRGTDLTGTIGIASISNVGTEGRSIYAVTHIDGPMFQIESFWGDFEAAKAEVATLYSGEYSRHLKPALMAIDMLVALLEAQNE